MNSHQAFLHGLETIRSMAEKSGGAVTVADILSAFPGVQLDEDQIGQIYEYLNRENIMLADYIPHDTRSISLFDEEEEAALTEEEQKIFDFYLEDLEHVLPLSAAEEKKLTKDLLGGSDMQRQRAFQRLTEGNLHYVVSIAREFSGKGVPLNDLIQEGNLSLMESLQDYSAEDGDLEDYLEKAIKKDLRAFVKEETGFHSMQEDMTREANRILEEIKEAEAEENRALSAEELSKRLGIPASRVEQVLRESARAIKNTEK